MAFDRTEGAIILSIFFSFISIKLEKYWKKPVVDTLFRQFSKFS